MLRHESIVKCSCLCSVTARTEKKEKTISPRGSLWQNSLIQTVKFSPFIGNIFLETSCDAPIIHLIFLQGKVLVRHAPALVHCEMLFVFVVSRQGLKKTISPVLFSRICWFKRQSALSSKPRVFFKVSMMHRSQICKYYAPNITRYFWQVNVYKKYAAVSVSWIAAQEMECFRKDS